MPNKAKGNLVEPINKSHPIIDESFVLFEYDQYENIILQGSYSYPFTVYLPEWLPQSHLCFNTPDAKKDKVINNFKIRYNLSAKIMSTKDGKLVQCVKQGITLEEMQEMEHRRRITVITPEFSDPLLNQQIKIESKIKSMGLMGNGTCAYICKFEKDVLYPNDKIKLTVDIDN